MAIISGLMIGIELPENYAHQKIYQEILQKLGKISHAHLFHNSATMTNGYNWCPTNIYDLPVTLSANTLQIEENGNLFGEWNIMSLDHIKDESIVLGHAHPLIEGKVRLAQKEKDQHMLLVEPEFTLGQTRISRGLLVKPSLRREKNYLDCVCDYIGPVYFHPPLIRSDIPNFDPTLLFKVHVGNDETTHKGSHQSTERRQSAQSMIQDMKNGSLHPQYRKRESDLKTFDVTAWDELKLLAEFKKAAADGDYENTKALLEKVRDPNHTDESGWSALHHAVWSGETKVAKLLVKRLNLQQQTARGEEPLHLASERGNNELRRWGGFTGIVDEILNENWEINATDPTGQTALHMAADRGREDVVHTLTKQNADHGLKDNKDRTALSLAVFGGHESTAKLLRNAGADPNVHQKGITLLQQAGMLNNNTAIKILGGLGADLDTRNGFNAIEHAAWNGHVEIIETLVQLEVDLETRHQFNQTPLHSAAGNGQVNVIKTLVKLGADLEAQNNRGWTPLYLAAINGQANAIETLAKFGADPKVQDNVGWTPLHLAADNGQVNAIETLVRVNADLEAQDKYNQTSLHLAANNGQVNAIETLVKLGADLEAQNNRGRTPLHLAANNGKVNAIETLAKFGVDLEAQDSLGWTPLHLAADSGQVNAIETLVRVKADLEARDKYDQTSLHLAVNSGRVNAVETLAKFGADLEAQDNLGRTPLHLAADNGEVNAIEALAKLGANLEAQNTWGQTPLHLAEDGRHDLAIKILGELIKARLTKDSDVDIVNES
ncbi:hypothetical protein N7519_000375 [Penicillium mononematosum]|uniref:uncharacterized protein n=1 Tax=Penicillium mononematosum TaxID=268346 RepID=UPI0025482DF4|nr:uncharacterized protein N7519_000375 [Penicillium mononematosum]KAJ6190354.1 hypothetical protein N7519_000375 [Penicillium mononematosum]